MAKRTSKRGPAKRRPAKRSAPKRVAAKKTKNVAPKRRPVVKAKARKAAPRVKAVAKKQKPARPRPSMIATTKAVPFAPETAVAVAAPEPVTDGPSTSSLELIVKEVEAGLAGITKEEALDNVVDALSQVAHYNWVGVYLLDGDTLVLGPFRGAETEHVRIPIGQGICGLAARTAATVNVPDVNKDSRYLACFLNTRSELVVPIFDPSGKVCGEIDIDSDTTNAFTQVDESIVERIARLLTPFFASQPESTASERFIGTN